MVFIIDENTLACTIIFHRDREACNYWLNANHIVNSFRYFFIAFLISQPININSCNYNTHQYPGVVHLAMHLAIYNLARYFPTYFILTHKSLAREEEGLFRRRQETATDSRICGIYLSKWTARVNSCAVRSMQLGALCYEWRGRGQLGRRHLIKWRSKEELMKKENCLTYTCV